MYSKVESLKKGLLVDKEFWYQEIPSLALRFSPTDLIAPSWPVLNVVFSKLKILLQVTDTWPPLLCQCQHCTGCEK